MNCTVIVGDAFARPILARTRRRPGPVGPVEPGGGDLVRGHVERGDQAGTPPPPPGHAADRRLRLVGGARDRDVGVVERGVGPRRRSSPWVTTSGSSTPTADVEPGFGPGRRARPRRADPPRLLQGRGQVPATFRSSTASATRSPVTTRRSRGRLHPPAGSWVGVHQHRGREGLPRGGRGGREDPRRVLDAVVVGIPDERFGEEIIAVVQLQPGVRRTRSHRRRSSST